jgi:hypothetical protein
MSKPGIVYKTDSAISKAVKIAYEVPTSEGQNFLSGSSCQRNQESRSLQEVPRLCEIGAGFGDFQKVWLYCYALGFRSGNYRKAVRRSRKTRQRTAVP